MSAGLGRCNKIRHIVKLRQMLRRWRNKARVSAERIPSDVPAGHVAICVGTSCRRFVVRATYLNHPVFEKLLLQAEEEFGFTNQGPLAIPCDESVFEEAIRFISLSESGRGTRLFNLDDVKANCHVGVWTESRPVLHELADKSILQEAEKRKHALILTRGLTQPETGSELMRRLSYRKLAVCCQLNGGFCLPLDKA